MGAGIGVVYLLFSPRFSHFSYLQCTISDDFIFLLVMTSTDELRKHLVYSSFPPPFHPFALPVATSRLLPLLLPCPNSLSVAFTVATNAQNCLARTNYLVSSAATLARTSRVVGPDSRRGGERWMDGWNRSNFAIVISSAMGEKGELG